MRSNNPLIRLAQGKCTKVLNCAPSGYANFVCRAPGCGPSFPKMIACRQSVAQHGSREMLQTYEGGCHCGRVRFRIRVDLEQSTVGECNCSICTKKGILHIGVTPGQFEP